MTGALGIQIRKEARALLPMWLLVAAATTVVAVLAHRNSGFPNFRNDLEVWVVIVYTLGALSVAALAMGHEISHGTLSSLLVQPMGRLRMLCMKFAVLIPAIVVLGVLAEWAVVDRYLSSRAVPRGLLVWGPVIVGIGLVPLITLLTRKPLAGIVFSIAIPGIVLTAATIRYPLQAGGQAWSIAWYGTIVLSALGAFALVNRFLSLEAIGDARDGIALRGESRQRARVATARHWIWLTVRKEIRLQYLTFALSGIYVVIATLIAVAQRLDPSYLGPTFRVISELHGAFIALVAGSLASAEERHLGMTASQALLPLPAWRQWSIKATVSLAVVVMLSAGVPMLLAVIARPPGGYMPHQVYVVGLLLLTGGAMYVSSLSTNALWALLASIPAIGVGFALTSGLSGPAMRMLKAWMPFDYRQLGIPANLFSTNREAYYAFRDQIRWVYRLERDLEVIVPIGVVLLALYFAARNHRSLERSVRLIAGQAATFVIGALVATVVYFAIVRIAWGTIG